MSLDVLARTAPVRLIGQSPPWIRFTALWRALTAGLAASIALTGVTPAAAESPAETSPLAHFGVFSLPGGDAVLERNKRTVLAFYDLAFNQAQPAEAMRRYGGATYTQHNPEVADGREAFIAFFEQMAHDYPGMRVSFKRVFAEGAYVTLHGEHTFPGWFGGRWAAIDLFRLDDEGRIVEHWDVLQKVPARAAHPNGMF